MTQRQRFDLELWLLLVGVGLFLAWAMSGCAAFKPASGAGPDVKLWALVPKPPQAIETGRWELRRTGSGPSPQTLSLEEARGFTCVSEGDLEQLLKAIIGVR